MEALRPIDTQSTTKRVLLALREAIFTQKLPPGLHTTQSSIAKQLNVSITPVREALMTLEMEQLVKIVAHKETIILGVSRKYLEDYYHTRAVLEGYLASLVCAPGVDISPIESAYTAMEQVVNQGDYDAYAAANAEFHRAIHKAAGNNFISNFLSQISISRSAAKTSTSQDYVKTSFAEHKRLMEFIRARDAEKAAEEMRKHMLRSLDDMLTYYPDSISQEGLRQDATTS